MLTLTENAQTAVDDVAARADLPVGGGLRIAPSPTQPGGIELTLAPGPEPTDEVIQTGTTPVFVDAEAVTQLETLVLDTAEHTATAEPGFVLAPQQA